MEMYEELSIYFVTDNKSTTALAFYFICILFWCTVQLTEIFHQIIDSLEMKHLYVSSEISYESNVFVVW